VLFVGFLVIAVAGVLSIAVAAPAAQLSPHISVRTVKVQPGDTLWGIATRHDPEAEPRVAIQEIRRLNHLSGGSISAGQQLVLPG
jgi:LysM repeat protein